MKDRKKQSSGSKSDTIRRYQGMLHSITAQAKDFFLQKHRVIEGASLLAFAVVCGGVVLFFILPSSVDDTIPEPEKQALAVPLIGELEEWIKERQREYENPISVPAQAFRRNVE